MTRFASSGTSSEPEQRGAADSVAAPECNAAIAAPEYNAAPAFSGTDTAPRESADGSRVPERPRRRSHRDRSAVSAAPMTAAEARRLLPELATVETPLDDRYLSLRSLSAYSSVSVRTLRAWIKDPLHPLPCFRVGGEGGKVLVRRSDFDRWMARYRIDRETDVDAIVRAVLDDVA